MVTTGSSAQETDVRALPDAHRVWRTHYFLPTSMDVVGHSLPIGLVTLCLPMHQMFVRWTLDMCPPIAAEGTSSISDA